MTKELHFEGVFTALVTPFKQDLSVDYDTLRELVEFQVLHGVEGIVPVGTTGESPTLTTAEHIRVIEVVTETVNGRCLVIAGTGANSTAEAIELTKAAQSAGADATLQVTPYYNKPNAQGLIRHFLMVADLGLPVVLYNVPGRSARDIPLSVVTECAAHPHVVAIKEAAGSVDRVSEICDACDLAVLSGDDSLTLPMMSVGASGVISVASNLIPREVRSIVTHALKGNYAEARSAHRRCYRLFRDLFIDTNPIPVKTAMAMLGRIDEVFRLPLCAMSAGPRAALRQSLIQQGFEAESVRSCDHGTD